MCSGVIDRGGRIVFKQAVPVFSDYENNTVIGTSQPPQPLCREKNFISNADGSSLLSTDSVELSGIEDVIDLNVHNSMTAKLKCTYRSIQGAFKLIAVSDGGKVTTLFDSEKIKNGAIVSVPFLKGKNSVRLIGKPVKLEDFSATWMETQHFESA